MNQRSAIGLAITMVLHLASTSNAQNEIARWRTTRERSIIQALATVGDPRFEVSLSQYSGMKLVFELKAPEFETGSPSDYDDDDFVEDSKPPAKVRRTIRDYAVASESFDQLLFLGMTSPDQKRGVLSSALEMTLDSARAKHNLTDAQTEKLRLACRGDVKRFLDRVERSRNEFEAARTDYGKALKLLESFKPLTGEFRGGLFGDGSLFAKTLSKIVADRQATPKD